MCRCLGLSLTAGASHHLHGLDASEKVTLGSFEGNPATGRGNPRRVAISESGLYKLVMRAQKANPKAREFQDWVAKVVLPAIRKDGMYVAGEEKLDLSKDADLTKMTLAVMEALQKKAADAEARAAREAARADEAIEKFEKAEPPARVGKFHLSTRFLDN